MNRLVPGVLLAGGWLALLVFGPVTLFWVEVVIAACPGLVEYFPKAPGWCSPFSPVCCPCWWAWRVAAT